MSIPIGYYKNVYFSPKVYIFCFCGQKGSLQLNIKYLFGKNISKMFSPRQHSTWPIVRQKSHQNNYWVDKYRNEKLQK